MMLIQITKYISLIRQQFLCKNISQVIQKYGIFEFQSETNCYRIKKYFDMKNNLAWNGNI
jgi:hypothetical protein